LVGALWADLPVIRLLSTLLSTPVHLSVDCCLIRCR